MGFEQVVIIWDLRVVSQCSVNQIVKAEETKFVIAYPPLSSAFPLLSSFISSAPIIILAVTQSATPELHTVKIPPKYESRLEFFKYKSKELVFVDPSYASVPKNIWELEPISKVY